MAVSASAQHFLFPLDYHLSPKSEAQSPESFLFDHYNGQFTWKKDTVTISPLGSHFLMQGFYNGIAVKNFTAKVSIGKNGRFLNVALPEMPKVPFDKVAAVSRNTAPSWLFENGWTDAKYHISHPWVYNNGRFEQGTVILVNRGRDFFEVILGTDGNLLDSLDRNVYSKPDTVVNTYVFAPDPLTTAETEYDETEAYTDSNDTDIPELNAQRMLKQITVRWDTVDSVWKLESGHCKILDLREPFLPVATSADGDFVFTRSQSGFEDVMCYFHINNQHDYLESIGFGSLVDFPIVTDPHADTADQSAFYEGFHFPNTPIDSTAPALFFGTGGVDDAEDADVIIHEYGHAMMFSAAPKTNLGNERNAIDEGFGDYLAAAYSLQYSPFNSTWVFNWDGHNEFWAGRTVESEKTYPGDLTRNIYRDGNLWSSTLMDIYHILGRGKTDKILLASTYSYSQNMTMQQAALLFMQSMDSLFPSDADRALTETIFCDRGFWPGCEDTITEPVPSNQPFLRNTHGLAARNEPAFIDPNGYLVHSIAITDFSGRILEKRDQLEDLPLYPLFTAALREGMYLVVIETNQGRFTEKFFVPSGSR